MIQIDDAGNGAVLGGEAIGAFRVETGEYAYRVLPLSAYSDLEISRTTAAREAVISLLQELKHAAGEQIVFCTGDIFKEAKSYLSAQAIPWQEEKITGELQEYVEASFFNSLRQYGLPENFRQYHHEYQKFHNMVLGWVYQDLERRSRFCKPLRLNSGLIARAKVYQTVVQKNQPCAVCSETIIPGATAVLDKSGETPAYYHLSCFPAEINLCDFQEMEVAGEPARSFICKFSPPPICPACQKLVKFKKRAVLYRKEIFHFGCFASRIRELAGQI